MPVLKGNAPLNTLKAQPGQYDTYHPQFHPLPGVWAQEQLAGKSSSRESGSKEPKHSSTEISRALSAENAQHNYWEEWQGVRPGKAVYEDPRSMQNTLLPTAKYGVEGRTSA